MSVGKDGQCWRTTVAVSLSVATSRHCVRLALVVLRVANAKGGGIAEVRLSETDPDRLGSRFRRHAFATQTENVGREVLVSYTHRSIAASFVLPTSDH